MRHEYAATSTADKGEEPCAPCYTASFENNDIAHNNDVDRDSSDSIATGYGLGGPGIESRLGGDFFRTCPDRPWGPSSLLYNG